MEDVSPDDLERYFEGGPLYRGPKTICMQRWGFWTGRFQQISEGESGVIVGMRELARQAAQTMRATEQNMGHTI